MSYTVIFCEGITDRVFLGQFLKTSDLRFYEISGYDELPCERLLTETKNTAKKPTTIQMLIITMWQYVR